MLVDFFVNHKNQRNLLRQKKLKSDIQVKQITNYGYPYKFECNIIIMQHHNNILYSKTPSKRLKSRKPLRPFLESLQGYDPQQEPILHKLQPHIQDWSNKPLGHGLPRKTWVQQNRLRTGIGKFGDSMVK